MVRSEGELYVKGVLYIGFRARSSRMNMIKHEGIWTITMAERMSVGIRGAAKATRNGCDIRDQ